MITIEKETKFGTIRGTVEDGCQIFRGVPYAQAPVGELRFRKPQPLKPWTGTYDATTYKARCMQAPERPGFYKKEFYSDDRFSTPVSEDGLFLNIWAPDEAVSAGKKLPVAIYVHGGAFLGGAGSNLPFVCTHLAKSGVIVVTINYRLGLWGFLSHPCLAEKGENAGGGNFGLWDQLAAFRWVKDNIASFGGDAENISVFGQSAGAMSLQVLSVCKASEGLFKNMVLQSGGGYRNPLMAHYPTVEEASEVAEEVLELLGCPKNASNEEKRQCLMTATSDKLLEVCGPVIGHSFQSGKGFPFVPIIDGELLTADVNELIDAGKYLDINYYLGANSQDLTAEKSTGPEDNPMHMGNMAFAEKINAARKAGTTSAQAQVYYFKRQLPGDDAGAFHSAELWYVFGSLEYCWRPLTEDDRKLSDRMIADWNAFFTT
ncbi:MAG: carboxylesterase family protein, partial [Treponemataceae bacterium]|nr:carboxylesterase family protein [Treponemataceae bacterium]